MAEALAMVFSVTFVTAMFARDIWAYRTVFQKREPQQPEITYNPIVHTPHTAVLVQNKSRHQYYTSIQV